MHFPRQFNLQQSDDSVFFYYNNRQTYSRRCRKSKLVKAITVSLDFLKQTISHWSFLHWFFPTFNYTNQYGLALIAMAAKLCWGMWPCIRGKSSRLNHLPVVQIVFAVRLSLPPNTDRSRCRILQAALILDSDSTIYYDWRKDFREQLIGIQSVCLVWRLLFGASWLARP
jgi:hypothetical protein